MLLYQIYDSGLTPLLILLQIPWYSFVGATLHTILDPPPRYIDYLHHPSCSPYPVVCGLIGNFRSEQGGGRQESSGDYLLDQTVGLNSFRSI